MATFRGREIAFRVLHGRAVILKLLSSTGGTPACISPNAMIDLALPTAETDSIMPPRG